MFTFVMIALPLVLGIALLCGFVYFIFYVAFDGVREIRKARQERRVSAPRERP